MHKATRCALPAATLLRRHHAGKRVLLAEDEPINQGVTTDLLQEVGLEADVAEDGAQSVLMAEATYYVLILMDMQMTVMDGLNATQFIHALPGHAATPILAMTGRNA
jgi:CheY-like chemotaxis protein